MAYKLRCPERLLMKKIRPSTCCANSNRRADIKDSTRYFIGAPFSSRMLRSNDSTAQHGVSIIEDCRLSCGNISLWRIKPDSHTAAVFQQLHNCRHLFSSIADLDC